MALTHHAPISLMIGDEWLIVGTLLDEDGAPLDLQAAGTSFGWTLLGDDGNQVPGVEDAATLETEAGGVIRIVVSDSFTRKLTPARYMNSIRVWVGGEPATHWIGLIEAEADPFHTTIEEPEVVLLTAEPRRVLSAPLAISAIDVPLAGEPSPLIGGDHP